MHRDRLVRKAKNSAYGLLKWRQRTKKELCSSLKDKGFSKSVIEQVVDDLQSYGMLNDELYAQRLVQKRLNNNKWGKRKIKRELIFKGISPELTESVLKTVSEEQELGIALQLVNKRLAGQGTDKSTVDKLWAYLNRRGFSVSVIYEVGKYVRETD